jgi:hypothetical protein
MFIQGRGLVSKRLTIGLGDQASTGFLIREKIYKVLFYARSK